MKRPILAIFGSKGHRLAKVYRLGRNECLVECWVRGRLRRKTFTDPKAAKVYAKVWYEQGLGHEEPSLSLRELFDRYIGTMKTQRNWRGSTILLREQERKRIEAVLTPDLPVARLSPAHLDTIWTVLTDQGMAPSQVQRRCQFLRHVAAWGHSRDYIPHAKLAGWSSPAVATTQVAEYTTDEVQKLLAHFRHEPRGVRPYAALLLAQSHGFRANALLHLRWEDIDGEVITLRAAHDKTKREWSRPLTIDGKLALETMRAYQRARGIETPWVFHGARNPMKPYTYGALWLQLGNAEEACGILHLPRRALHGLRRHAVNTARQVTGDAALGLMWVGDRDMSQAVSYVRTREDELNVIANRPGIVSGVEGRKAKGCKVLGLKGLVKPAMGLEPMTPPFEKGPIVGVSQLRTPITGSKDHEEARNSETNRPATVFRPLPRPPHIHPDAGGEV